MPSKKKAAKVKIDPKIIRVLDEVNTKIAERPLEVEGQSEEQIVAFIVKEVQDASSVYNIADYELSEEAVQWLTDHNILHPDDEVDPDEEGADDEEEANDDTIVEELEKATDAIVKKVKTTGPEVTGKPVKKKKKIVKESNRQVNKFGHLLGSQGAVIDTLLGAGGTRKDISTKLAEQFKQDSIVADRRVYSHILHLRKLECACLSEKKHKETGEIVYKLTVRKADQ